MPSTSKSAIRELFDMTIEDLLSKGALRRNCGSSTNRIIANALNPKRSTRTSTKTQTNFLEQAISSMDRLLTRESIGNKNRFSVHGTNHHTLILAVDVLACIRCQSSLKEISICHKLSLALSSLVSISSRFALSQNFATGLI